MKILHKKELIKLMKLDIYPPKENFLKHSFFTEINKFGYCFYSILIIKLYEILSSIYTCCLNKLF